MTTSRPFFPQRAPIFPSSPSLVMEPVDVELQSARCLFGEKVKELSVAVAKVDALTRQLEELRSGNTSNSYHVVSGHTVNSGKVNQEYEKLRNELLHRNKLIDDQNSELSFKKTLLSQKKSELLQIDDRIHELQQRLAKKKQRNQQQVQAQAAMHQSKSSVCPSPLSYSPLRSSVGPGVPGYGVRNLLPVHRHRPGAWQVTSGSNIAAVEPMQRLHHSSGDQNHVNNMHDVVLNGRQPQSQTDTKFQTLPHNTKFGRSSLISCNDSRESSSPSSTPTKYTLSDRVLIDPTSPSVIVNGYGKHSEVAHEPNDEERAGDAVDRQAPCSRGQNSDWQKDRRKPVIVDEDMELALSAPMSSNCSPEPEAISVGKVFACDRPQISCPMPAQIISGPCAPSSAPTDRRYDSSQRVPPSVTIVSSEPAFHLLKNASDCCDVNGNESGSDASQLASATNALKSNSFSDKSLPPASSSSASSSPSSSSPSSAFSADEHKHVSPLDAKQMNGWKNKSSSKGNLKNSHTPTSASKPLTRRVSFDPLALLLDAALEGELDLVKKTASQVPDPSAAKDEGLTALHNAICAGHFPVMRFLVEFGCDVNAQDSEGWTPLHCAASCNNLKMVEFLVEHGACVFATTFSDHETASQKCDEEESGFDACSQYLCSIEEKMGVVNGGVVYAAYDYDAQKSDELSFRDGDRVCIVRKGDEQEIDWWWARMTSPDSEGYVPRTLFALFPRVRPQRSSARSRLRNDLSAQ